MENLIKALTILLKYGNHDSPTHCEHDTLMIVGIDPNQVSQDDQAELERLGFHISTEYGEPCFISFRYGSA